MSRRQVQEVVVDLLRRQPFTPQILRAIRSPSEIPEAGSAISSAFSCAARLSIVYSTRGKHDLYRTVSAYQYRDHRLDRRQQHHVFRECRQYRHNLAWRRQGRQQHHRGTNIRLRPARRRHFGRCEKPHLLDERRQHAERRHPSHRPDLSRRHQERRRARRSGPRHSRRRHVDLHRRYFQYRRDQRVGNRYLRKCSFHFQWRHQQ